MSRSGTDSEPNLAAWTAPRVSQPNSDWHARSLEEVARALAADPDNGLTWAEAKRRGATQPAADVPPSSLAWRILLNQLKGGVIVVLLLATVVTWVMGHHGDSVGIGASVVFSVVCGFLTDFRAERALAALKSLTAPTARVIREGLEHEIPASTLQLGDLVVLSAGQIIAADGRLVDVRDLQVDESLLTGESQPVAKSPVPLEPGVGLSDRRNMAFCGTTVSGGYGRMLVTGARDETELGRIGRLVQEHAKEATPLERQAEQLGRQLALLVIGLCTVTTVLGLLRGRPLWLMVETGVILAIAAIPEGLPAVTTVALAAGVRRMARARSLVRRLSSVETLGSVSVICTDKTGTLTENVMRATQVHLSARVVVVTGSGYRPEGEFLCDGQRLDVSRDSEIQRLLQVAVLCNNAKLESHERWHVHGSSTEGALLALAAKAGLSPEDPPLGFARVRELAFTSDRKRMTVVGEDAQGRLWSFVKGSPEVLLPRCRCLLTGQAETPLGPEHRSRLLNQSRTLGEAGHRVLALAFRAVASLTAVDEAEEDLTWVGLVAITDPPRAGVQAAIQGLDEAGIRTVMVTGDQKATATAVARELGVFEPGDLCLDSAELARYVEEHRWADLHRTVVFARVTPQDKLAVVKALRAAGHIVGMTGDGINDAPAMKVADIGIAIGSGSADVAKEAADLVVTDADYAALPAAVAEGRQIYSNIRRAIQFLLLCSFSTIWVMLFSIVANLELPMSPLQILWLNLAVHIFPGIALALVPGESGLMQRPPRDPRESLLSWRQTAMIGARSLVVAAAAIWIYASEHRSGDLPHAQTLVMATLAVTLLLQMLSALSERRSFLRMTRSLRPTFWLALGGGLAIQLMAVYWTLLGGVLQTVPLSVPDWQRIAAVAVIALIVVEAAKAMLPRLKLA